MTVSLKKPSRRHSLTFGNRYRVLGIEADDRRIIDNNGRPYLYPAKLFEVVDSREPKDWVLTRGESGERYAYPPALNKPGFFEDVFDYKRSALTTLFRYLEESQVRPARKLLAVS